MNVNICFPNMNDGSAGQPVQVTVTATYNWLNYLAGKFGFPGTTLRGKATMRIEKAYTGNPLIDKYIASSCP
jgi:hypothetical protein